MYNDNFRQQVIYKLGKIYRAFKLLNLDVQINDNNNIYKHIINGISNVYSYGVDRTFEDEAAQVLYQELRINKIMTQANRYMNAFNDVLLQVSWADDKPKLMLRLPHLTEVEYSNGHLHCVKYYIQMLDKNTEQWAYWSADEHYYIERKGGTEKIVAVEDNDEMINPFGVLPFVVMHNGWRDESFFDAYTGDDLVNGTIDLAVHLTFLNHIIKSQSFKQLVGKGDNVGEMLGQVLDPLSILTLTGQNTEIQVLDMQSNYEQLHKVTQEMANNLAINYGISPNQFRMSGSPTSGFALKMENVKLDRFTVEQQQDFKMYEKELYKLIQMVSEYYGTTISGDINVNFVEPTYPESEQEQMTSARERIDLGLTSPHEILMQHDPDLTAEEAVIKVNDNISKRNEMLDKIRGGATIVETTSAVLDANA
tara:strand:+ start:61 stop:1329 length:1269 start_codon:yes stop_codon:yes gene_type:complete